MFFDCFKSRILEKVTRAEIVSLIPDAEFVQILDRDYFLPSDEEVLDKLGKDITIYESEKNDCDDFAFQAKGLICSNGWPFGVAFVNGSHYINVYVNDKKEFVFFEPQTRKKFDKVITKIQSIII